MSLIDGALLLLDFAKPRASGDVALVSGVDDLLHHGDEVGVIVFVRDAHVGRHVVRTDEKGAHAGDGANRIEILHRADGFDHRHKERVGAFLLRDILAGLFARPFAFADDFFERLALQRSIHRRCGEALELLHVLRIRNDHAVEGIAHLRHVILVATVRACERRDAFRGQRIAQRHEVGDVERVVLRGDDDEIEQPIREEIHDGRHHRMLHEHAKDRVALHHLVFEHAGRL
jgi:hypothetical protein